MADYQTNALRTRLTEIGAVYDREGSTFTTNLETLTISTDGAGYELDVEAAIPAIESALLRPNNRAVALPIIGGDTGRPVYASAGKPDSGLYGFRRFYL